jgi:aminoglycoside phosphotransferase
MPVEELRPVNQSIQEINDHAWVIGDRILLSRTDSPCADYTWRDDGHGSFYIIADAPSPLPPSRRPLSATTKPAFNMVYDAGEKSAVWSIGDAFCKVKILDPDTTREHVTLNYLHHKRPLSFAIPKVHYHAEYDGRYYIILSKLPGLTLSEAWLDMAETMKQQYVSRVTNVCKELAQWQADDSIISGVDGQYLSDRYLTPRAGLPTKKDFSPGTLLNNCKDVGMDCSTLVFYHCDLGPGNIIVDPTKGSIGIIDWETAGFVPREWIRTKFRVSGGMDLPGDDRVDWRKRVQIELGKEGFLDVAHKWSLGGKNPNGLKLNIVNDIT